MSDIEPSVVYREGPLTERDYNEAIEDLQNAKTQLTPDGNCCAVCGDSGHQAQGCHHNPLVKARAVISDERTWRCYHCGYVATSHAEAEAHFGLSDANQAACVRSTLPPDTAKGGGDVECATCHGDGIERCDNPDHGILNAISFRGANESACPCCGHDEKYRMKTWNNCKYEWNKCPDCNGTRLTPPAPDAERIEELLAEACDKFQVSFYEAQGEWICDLNELVSMSEPNARSSTGTGPTPAAAFRAAISAMKEGK